MTPTTSLALGPARWYVQSWNTDGFGPWSNALSFTVAAGDGTAAALMVTVDGVPLGRFVGYAPRYAQPVNNMPQPRLAAGVSTSPSITAISSTGYYFGIIAAPEYQSPQYPQQLEGQLLAGTLLFSQTGCTGQRYGVVSNGTTPPNDLDGGAARWVARSGFVIASPDPADLNPAYYAPAQQTPRNVTFLSALARSTSPMTIGAVCAPISGTAFAVDMLPNNPTVTGVPSITTSPMGGVLRLQ